MLVANDDIEFREALMAQSSHELQFLSFFFLSFCPVRAALAAYGGSQARGLVGAVAASLRQSHSSAGSEPRLRPTPQLNPLSKARDRTRTLMVPSRIR